MLTLIHVATTPCQPIFKIIESRHNSVNNFFKQLLGIGLGKFLEINLGMIFFIAVFMSNVSVTIVVNGRDSSVGDIIIFSSISGSESTDLGNL
jgi:hypothetical protein